MRSNFSLLNLFSLSPSTLRLPKMAAKLLSTARFLLRGFWKFPPPVRYLKTSEFLHKLSITEAFGCFVGNDILKQLWSNCNKNIEHHSQCQPLLQNNSFEKQFHQRKWNWKEVGLAYCCWEDRAECLEPITLKSKAFYVVAAHQYIINFYWDT